MSAVAKVHAAWGGVAPDWVIVLANECDISSQNKVAKRLGYSAAAVSCVLSGKYAGSFDRLEAKVRAVLMRDVVDCPSLGEIPSADCKVWKEKSTTFRAVNPMRVQMFRACRTCSRNQLKKPANTETGETP